MPTTICQTCYAVLPVDERAVAWHAEWHGNISRVAIENTKRIEELTKRVQELEARYR